MTPAQHALLEFFADLLVADRRLQRRLVGRQQPVDHRRLVVLDAAAGGPDDISTVVSYGYRGEPHLEHHAFVGNTTLVYEYPDSHDHDERAVACVSLGSLGPIDFLKIDCEGCEWSVLTDPAVSEIPRIHGEWHPTPKWGAGGKAEIIRLLSPTHDLMFSGPEAGPGGFTAGRHAV